MDIGIVRALVRHGRFRTVAGVNHRVARQRINLLSDGVLELLEISAGQIGASNAAVEQRITDERLVVGSQIE